LSLLLGVAGHIVDGEYRPGAKPLYPHASEELEHACDTTDGDAKFAGEGLYVVEHILLRRQVGSMSTSETPPHGEDFYSYRISVVLPNWPARFRGAGFRSFAENLIRENCPAHLLCRCYWLNPRQTYVFERLFLEWEDLKLNNGDPVELETVGDTLKDLLHWFDAAPDVTEAEPGGPPEWPGRVLKTLRRIERRRPGNPSNA